ncbi:hypothetical protein LCGC14_1712420 [marine sediment metagenome]|uniref:Uncharacterized protein n=1 Tax=marine sediment metagenome TaxID=412755 RepID=A0A0F9HFA6_9ZZZZ
MYRSRDMRITWNGIVTTSIVIATFYYILIPLVEFITRW